MKGGEDETKVCREEADDLIRQDIKAGFPSLFRGLFEDTDKRSVMIFKNNQHIQTYVSLLYGLQTSHKYMLRNAERLKFYFYNSVSLRPKVLN